MKQELETENKNVQQSAGQVNNLVDADLRRPAQMDEDRRQRLEKLDALRLTTATEVAPEVSSLSVDGIGFFALDDVHAIKAKAKQGKTTMLKVCLSAWLRGSQFRVKSELEEPRILWLDTEQKQSDVKLIISDVLSMAGVDAAYVDSHLFLYGLRKRDFDGLKDDLVLLISEVHPQVVVIDGIVEFVASFNDEGEAKQLIHRLLCIAEDWHCAIVNVLHTNKADEDHNMRGHLGTMLQQKAGTVLECRKLDAVITVSCSDARHEEMPAWSIMFDDSGRIVDADEQRRQQIEAHKAELQQRRQQASAEKQKERLDYALLCIRDHGGSISRKQLTEILMKKFGLERTTVSRFLTCQIEVKALYEVNKVIHASDEMALAF